MAKTSQVLAQAIQRHQAGELDEAERLYRAILEVDARHADAWHLLGLIAYSRGEFGKALDEIGRAIDLDGRQHTFFNHLAEAQRALGQLDEAAANCRRAIALKPDFAIGHNTLGTILIAQHNADEAIASYRRAIALDAGFAQAHYNLAMALHALAQPDEAIACFRRALAARPDYVLAEHNLGAVLQSQSRHAEAEACYRHILTLVPNDADAHCNLGSALKDQDRAAEAIDCYRRALAIAPGHAEAHFNLAIVHQAEGQLEAAAEHYRAAIRARPGHAEAHSNLGTVLKSLGNLTEAGACYEAALAIEPELAEAHRNRALLWLLLGNYVDGWPEYEWRWRVPGATPIPFTQPRWQGQPVAGRSVLVKAEQGLGDAIQFIRFAPLVKQQSQGRVLFQCPAALGELLMGAAGVDELIVDTSGRDFDCYVPMMSLPAVLGTMLETIGAEVPYLTADPSRVERWRDELARVPGFRAGIAWQGNPGYAADVERSVPLEHFAPLAACEGVRLFSLQKRHGLEQLAAHGERLAIVDLGKSLDEETGPFVDTAAAMKALDLIITSDTAIAHLAGALGVPVWVALPWVPDWRWLLERADSPWYPTMRLFRQQRRGDWRDVFSRIAQELQTLVR